MLAVREYRVLWSAQILSLLGDRLALLALTWLVYDRSGSALLSAAAFAVSLLPWVIGGPLLAGLADRYPRRELMVACDLARMALVAVMAIPGQPLWALFSLLFLTVLLSSPFNAARAAVLPDILSGDRYVLGAAVGIMTNQGAQVLGFAGGGLLVAVLRPETALALNCGTFLISAMLLRFGLRRRTAAVDRRSGSASSQLGHALRGIHLLCTDRRLRALTGLGLLSALYMVAEGLAVPYAAELGEGPVAAGFLLGAGPFGTALGVAALARWVPAERRLRLMGPLGFLACAALVPCALSPGLELTALLFALSGAASGYQVAANAAFVQALPASSRGQLFGLVQSLMFVSQGVAILLAGLGAHYWGPCMVIAVAGAVGCALASVAAGSWRAARQSGPPGPGASN